MPSLSFVLPHWLYWLGLIFFPLAAMYLVRRQGAAKTRTEANLLTGYLLWLTAGFIGIHRFYLKDVWGVIYIPLFLAVLFANSSQRDARLVTSNADNEVLSAHFMVEKASAELDDGREGAAGKLAQAERHLTGSRNAASAAGEQLEQIKTIASGIAIAIALLLIVDAVLLPGMIRRRVVKEAAEAADHKELLDLDAVMPGTQQDPAARIHTPLTDIIDRISGFTGEYVSYWSIIAVFMYYYEVVARYVFNSPTNWVHEGMFLMFGMQYLIAGAFALREDSHVRVDVIYLMFSDRGKALIDIITSFFFFIFVVALLVTGWIFAADSIEVWEVSLTEWAIQYWPVKMTIAIGALLLLLQGFAKLIKDVIILTGKEA